MLANVKMIQKRDSSHYFIDGYSPRRGLLGVVAYPNALIGSDAECMTFYMLRDGVWGHQNFDFEGRSVLYLGDGYTRSWWLLGKRGEIVRLGITGIQLEQIPDAGTGPGKFGYVNKLALIDNEMYVCGHGRQVYVSRNGGWQHHDHGILVSPTEASVGFESIDGYAADGLYAVGLDGEIWFFNGNTWRQCISPTNVDLNEVRCIDKDKVCVCGQYGTVLIGSLDDWSIISNEEFHQHLWGVDEFDGEIYVAGFGGIARLNGVRLEVIETGLGRVIPGYRLRSKDGLLWSIGNDDILCFDGSNWTEVICPDNI
jgi:hypothetical protein